ncbi:ATP-binding protein [Lysinibacillus sp. FSL K6-0232]|uniref:ATP-binding protein n=1 Tax=Lysinibacillus sp. FSL K6-0232 TaxID=2921425 RepID=UPI0030FA7F05
MNKIYLENGMDAIQASYHESLLEEYNSNPFIQALPPLMTKQAIIDSLAMPISFDESERDYDSAFRLHMVQRLYKLFQPLPRHLDVWNTTFSLLYQGYISRNPFDKDYIRQRNQMGKEIINKSFDINNQSTFRTTASCATLIGYSGMGKTSSVQRVLNNIPQVIVHNKYKEQPFNQLQLTHLTLQTPHSSSLKALTLQFFMKVDEILGTSNYKRNVSKNTSVDAMLPQMGQVANNIGLGLLVIDEIQHLQNRAIKQMMNYFVTLMNSFGVPILFIGTPAAYAIFQQEFRIARRVSGNGEISWNNMEHDKEFRFFLESLWRYQWTQVFTPLTDEMVTVFYEHTQGVSDLIVKLFANVQVMAISTGKEAFTASMVRKVAKEQFKLMQPMIDAIKSKNPYKMHQYEDLRKLEVEQQMHPIKQPAVSSVKVAKQSIAVKKPKPINTPQEYAYEQNDIRFSYQKNIEANVIYEALVKQGYIDDMKCWIGGVGDVK